MDFPLDEAQNYLQLKVVRLTNSKTFLNEDLELEEIITSDSVIQQYKVIKRVTEVNINEDSNEDEYREYRYDYALGMRVVNNSDISEAVESDILSDEPAVKVEVQATFSAEYYSKVKLTEEQRDAFAEENVGFNVWPFWREYVQSTCMRMNLKPIQVGFYKCKKSK